MGGGLRASADMAIQTGGRDIAAGNRDGKIVLSGGFGTFQIGSTDAGNGIYALGSAGAPVIGLDSLIIPDSGNIDFVSYTTPAFNGFNFRVLATDKSGTNAGDDHDLNLGMGSTAALQDSVVYGLTYTAGPLRVAADITNYGNNSIAASTARATDRTRLSASYDFGIARVGAGYETRDAKATSTAATVKTKDTLVGVSVPMGAFTFGLNYAKSSTAGEAYDKKGTDIGVRYDLSKRTFIALQHQKVKGVNLEGAAAAANKGSITRLQVSHAF